MRFKKTTGRHLKGPFGQSKKAPGRDLHLHSGEKEYLTCRGADRQRWFPINESLQKEFLQLGGSNWDLELRFPF